MNRIHRLALATLFALPAAGLTSTALAGADCPLYPKEEWMKPDDLKAALVDAGYKIKVFKVDGNCYEMYGWNEKGQKVEIYMDAKTGRPVKGYLKD